MADREAVANRIRLAFAATPYPGDAFLVGSQEGCEPEEECGPFRGRTDRDQLDAAFLDQHYTALSFFSEGAFRYFLPAYLLADLEDRLQTADPVFHLAGGFGDFAVAHDVGGKSFTRRSGRHVPLNPRRYGAMTFEDYARYRLSVFTREEAAAIVGYLECKRDADTLGVARETIDAALDLFWRERARSGPTAADLAAHLAEDEAYFRAILERREDR